MRCLPPLAATAGTFGDGHRAVAMGVVDEAVGVGVHGKDECEESFRRGQLRVGAARWLCFVTRARRTNMLLTAAVD